MSMRPLLIEISGIHNSGKTALIERATESLELERYKVKVFSESLEYEPSENYGNLNTAISNRQKFFNNLLSLQDYDIIIFDNCSYIKTLVDLDLFEYLTDDEEIMAGIKNLQDSFSTAKVNEFYYFSIEISPDEAIDREKDSLAALSLEDLQKKSQSYSKISGFIKRNFKDNIWFLKDVYFNEEVSSEIVIMKIKNILEKNEREKNK